MIGWVGNIRNEEIWGITHIGTATGPLSHTRETYREKSSAMETDGGLNSSGVPSSMSNSGHGMLCQIKLFYQNKTVSRGKGKLRHWGEIYLKIVSNISTVWGALNLPILPRSVLKWPNSFSACLWITAWLIWPNPDGTHLWVGVEMNFSLTQDWAFKKYHH